MRKGRTEDVLDILWGDEGKDLRKGVLAYGLFAGQAHEDPPFPAEVWPAGTQMRTRRFTDGDRPDYLITQWTILPVNWPRPNRWCTILEATLKALIDSGAVVAWCAVEGSFGTPPTLFDPDEMRDEVYAAMTLEEFLCRTQLDKLYTPLSRFEMTELMSATNQKFRSSQGDIPGGSR